MCDGDGDLDNCLSLHFPGMKFTWSPSRPLAFFAYFTGNAKIARNRKDRKD